MMNEVNFCAKYKWGGIFTTLLTITIIYTIYEDNVSGILHETQTSWKLFFQNKSSKLQKSPDLVRRLTIPPANSSNWLQFHRNISLALGRNSRIVYNRVPKCGSRTILGLMKIMKKKHHFLEKRSKFMLKFNLTKHFEKKQVMEILQMEKPVIFSRHMYFVNFEEFTNDVPFYINVVREPISQYVSAYYFYRLESVFRNKLYTKEEKQMTLDECIEMKHKSCSGDEPYISFIIPFFCGSQPLCGVMGRSSLERAKSNIEKYYSVVGFLEDIPNFVKILEYVFPQYFTGVTQAYEEIKTNEKKRKKFATAARIEPKPETVSVLKKKLKYEIEFYEWVKKRFYAGLDSISNITASVS